MHFELFLSNLSVFSQTGYVQFIVAGTYFYIFGRCQELFLVTWNNIVGESWLALHEYRLLFRVILWKIQATKHSHHVVLRQYTIYLLLHTDTCSSLLDQQSYCANRADTFFVALFIGTSLIMLSTKSMEYLTLWKERNSVHFKKQIFLIQLVLNDTF